MTEINESAKMRIKLEKMLYREFPQIIEEDESVYMEDLFHIIKVSIDEDIANKIILNFCNEFGIECKDSLITSLEFMEDRILLAQNARGTHDIDGHLCDKIDIYTTEENVLRCRLYKEIMVSR